MSNVPLPAFFDRPVGWTVPPDRIDLACDLVSFLPFWTMLSFTPQPWSSRQPSSLPAHFDDEHCHCLPLRDSTIGAPQAGHRHSSSRPETAAACAGSKPRSRSDTTAAV